MIECEIIIIDQENEEIRVGNIFYVMGKSSSGKDTIFQDLLERKELELKRIVLYTTRPIRAREKDGVEYYFVDDTELSRLERKGKVIEVRAYDTVEGIWKYATVDDGHIDLEQWDYLAIGTLVSYEKMQNYFGKNKVIPIYIEVADDLRLERAIKRERKQISPNYEELCRRFLADAQDFSEENLERAGIKKRFYNNDDRELCMHEAADYISLRKTY